MGYITNFPDGVASFGAPVGGRFSSPWATHYFVDYDNGNDLNKGTAPDEAYKTIQAAITAASAQDIIYVRPRAYQWARGPRRYEETITVPVGDTTGSGNVSDNAMMSLIGVTPRTASAADLNGVRLKAGSSATGITVNTHMFHMENIDIFAEGATAAIALTSTAWTTGADGFSMYNCCIKGAPSTTVGSSDISIVGCRFNASYDGVSASWIFGGTGNHQRPLIKNCEFLGGTTTAQAQQTWIEHESGSIIYNGIFRDLYFAEDNAEAAIVMRAADSGMIHNCYFAYADASSAITKGGMETSHIRDDGGEAS